MGGGAHPPVNHSYVESFELLHVVRQLLLQQGFALTHVIKLTRLGLRFKKLLPQLRRFLRVLGLGEIQFYPGHLLVLLGALHNVLEPA